jgi:hypothetical protein
MVQHDDRNLGEAQLPRGKQTSVASYDARLRVHEDGIVKSELRDACGDLGDLSLGVRPRISGPWNQLIDQPHLDVLGHPLEVRNWFSRRSHNLPFAPLIAVADFIRQQKSGTDTRATMGEDFVRQNVGFLVGFSHQPDID